MIMKRKLPSQSGKLDEDLMEKDKKSEAQTAEQTAQTASKEAAQSAGSSKEESQQNSQEQDQQKSQQQSDAAPTPEQNKPNTPESEAPKDTKTEEAQAPAPQNTQETQSFHDDDDDGNNAPGEIPDPFVHDESEDDMTLSAPPQRPTASDAQSSTPPRQRPVSTQALLGEDDKEQTSAQSGNQSERKESGKEKQDSGKPTLKDEELNDFFPQGQDNKTAPAGSDTDEESDDTWDLGDLVDVPEEHSQIGRSPFDKESETPDADPEQQEGAPPPEAKKLPPWKRKRDSGKTESSSDKGFTPSLPKVAAKAPSKMGAFVSLALVVLLIGGTAMFYQNRDAAVEKISRWTGTLNEVGQPVPATQDGTSQKAQEQEQQARLAAESVVRSQEKQEQQQQLEADARAAQEQRQQPEESTISMEVLDVAPDEADDPIVGDESVEMPEDIDKFSALQEAISRKRAERRGETSAKLEGEPEDMDPSELSPQEITRRNLEIVRQTNASLAEYRKALAEVDDPALKPRPGQFLREQSQQQGGDRLPPPSSSQQERKPEQQQQPELYGNRVVSDLSELVTDEVAVDDGLRTLEDFDVSVFDPQRRRVSIPKGITPRFSKDDFPPLEVISFVANQGIIGKSQGQEGVLFLGETIEGWELVNVSSNYAEFQKQGKKRIVTFNNANR